jgi:hypothetical protein
MPQHPARPPKLSPSSTPAPLAMARLSRPPTTPQCVYLTGLICGHRNNGGTPSSRASPPATGTVRLATPRPPNQNLTVAHKEPKREFFFPSRFQLPIGSSLAQSINHRWICSGPCHRVLACLDGDHGFLPDQRSPTLLVEATELKKRKPVGTLVASKKSRRLLPFIPVPTPPSGYSRWRC